MPRRRNEYDHNNELEHIREDIDSLKNNVVALTKSVQHEVADAAATRLAHIKSRGEETVKVLEKDIKNRPIQSILTAFGAGIILSMLMRRR